jgi:hypothetical protein
MNSLLKRLLAAALALPVLSAVTSSAAAAGEKTLATDKTVYEVGEDIFVTATGEGKDWVGIYARGETPGNPASIYWYYVDGDAEPGEPVNIRKTRSNNRAEYSSLPAGAYTVFLLENDGYTVLASVDIVILSEDGDRLSLSSAVYYAGDTPAATAFGRGGEKVVLYRAGEEEPLFSYDLTDGTNGRETALKTAAPLSEGSYTVKLYPADGTEGDPVSSVGFTVREAAPPEKPEKAVYTAERTAEGIASGTVTVTPSAGGNPPEDILLWWGKNGVPLEGYTRLAKVHGSADPVEIVLPENLTVPEGAEEILAASSNRFGTSGYVSAALPEGTKPFESGKVLLSFQVTSDWHVTDDPSHEHNRHVGMMLDDIVSVCPDSAGIMAVGDIADHGRKSEYDKVRAILDSRDGAPPVHFVIGNHDVSYGSGFASQLKIFNEFSGNDSLYYDLWIGGYHFIFIAGESTGAPLPIPKKEMQWLEEKLAEDSSPDKPIFVFCHESITDTVAGSTPEEGWWGVQNGTALGKLFSRYPQTVFFTGHSHWVLSSYNEMFAGDEKRSFSAFNTSSVGYLWTGYNIVPGEYEYGSEGLFVDICEHALTVRGRDFVNGLWTASAQYVVPGLPDPAAAQDPQDLQDPKEKEAEPVPQTPVPDEPAAADADSGTPENGAEKSGCAGAALSPFAAAGTACAAALLVRRKGKDPRGEREGSPEK